MRISKVLVSTIFFLLLFPQIHYFPFLPRYETSPIPGLLALFYIGAQFLLRIRQSPKTALPAFSAVLAVPAVCLLLSAVYFRRADINSPVYVQFFLKTSISLLLGCGIFSFFLYIKEDELLPGVLFAAVIIWCVGGIIYSVPACSAARQIMTIIKTRTPHVIHDRGVGIFASEPSYAGISLVCMLAIFQYFRIRNKFSVIKTSSFTIVFVFMVYITRSVHSFLLFVVFISISFVFYIVHAVTHNRRMLFIVPVCVLCAGILLNILSRNTQHRVGNLMHRMMNNPALLFHDQSIASRSAFIHLAFGGLIQSKGLGYGAGSYSTNWMRLADDINIFKKYPWAMTMRHCYKSRTPMMPMTFFGGVAHDYGIFGLAAVLFLLLRPLYKIIKSKYRICKREHRFVILATVLIVFIWMQACAYALSYPWIVLALCWRAAGINNVKLENDLIPQPHLK